MEDKEYESDPDWWKKIPMPSIRDWAIMRKIMYGEGNDKRYGLMKYAKGLDEFKDSKIDFKYIDKLVKEWKSHGLLTMEPAYKDSEHQLINRTPKGLRYADKVGQFYSSPT